MVRLCGYIMWLDYIVSLCVFLSGKDIVGAYKTED